MIALVLEAVWVLMTVLGCFFLLIGLLTYIAAALDPFNRW